MKSLLFLMGIVILLSGCATRSVETASARKHFNAQNALGKNGVVCVYRNDNSSKIFTHVSLLKCGDINIDEKSAIGLLKKINIFPPTQRCEGILSDNTYLGWIVPPGKYAIATSVALPDRLPIEYRYVYIFEIKANEHLFAMTDANGMVSVISDKKAFDDIHSFWNSKRLSDEYVQDMKGIKNLNQAPNTVEDSVVVGHYIGTGIGYTIASPFYVVYGVGWCLWKVVEIRYGLAPVSSGYSVADETQRQYQQQQNFQQQQQQQLQYNQNQAQQQQIIDNQIRSQKLSRM